LSALAGISEAVSRFSTERGFYLGARSTRVHVAIYRLSGGRLGGHVPGLPQARIALIDHTGARSGKRRTSPLMYCVRGDAIAVVASKGGQPTHPAWYHNLRANPETTIQVGGERRAVRARVADGEEREELWGRCVALFAGYQLYRELAAPRQIPIVVLEPREQPGFGL
jgi:deazaflavin-dependent oxidoreductase (nitroreductase family)